MEYPSLSTPTAGSIRFNTDSTKMEIYNGDAWWVLDGTSAGEETGSARGLFAGGDPGPASDVNVINYIQINTAGWAYDFGDLTVARSYSAGLSSRTRGLIAGSGSPALNTIDYVTIAQLGDAVDFGDLTGAYGNRQGGASNQIRGLVYGGRSDPAAGLNTVDYVTIASTGNANDYGDLTVLIQDAAGAASPTRAIRAGGSQEPSTSGTPASVKESIDYTTIATTGNFADFGNLTAGRMGLFGGSNAVRAVWGGGYNPALATIDYIPIAELGNATDFGDLQTATYRGGGTASRTRVVFAGGNAPSTTNTISFVNIAATGNATDWGDLTVALHPPAGMSNDHGGLG